VTKRRIAVAKRTPHQMPTDEECLAFLKLQLEKEDLREQKQQEAREQKRIFQELLRILK